MLKDPCAFLVDQIEYLVTFGLFGDTQRSTQTVTLYGRDKWARVGLIGPPREIRGNMTELEVASPTTDRFQA